MMLHVSLNDENLAAKIPILIYNVCACALQSSEVYDKNLSVRDEEVHEKGCSNDELCFKISCLHQTHYFSIFFFSFEVMHE